MGGVELLGNDVAQTRWSALGYNDQDVLFIQFVEAVLKKQARKYIWDKKCYVGKKSCHKSAAHCFHQSELTD